MLILFANDYLLHDPKFEYYDGKQTAYAEQAERLTRIIQACKDTNLPMREVTNAADTQAIAELHSTHYLRYLQNQCGTIAKGAQLMPSVFIKDTYTPLVQGTYTAAVKSASLALEAADEVLSGQQRHVYALCRPPGHHAERDAMMGYCYFNNAALAADRLAKGGKKVAILDIDYHHGNGTQNLFYERSDVLYVSIHADPTNAFPYGSGYTDETGKDAGKGYNVNFPMPTDTTPESYLKTLQEAIGKINDYKPEYFVLSLGFDTYEHDPIAGLGIDEDTYEVIGQKIASELAYPTVIVQEGGYNVEKLGELAKRFLTGYQSKSAL